MIWTYLWLLWIAGFAVIEGAAIMNDTKDDTLSEHVREWFRTDRKFGRNVWIVASGVFFSWFVIHIAVAGAA